MFVEPEVAERHVKADPTAPARSAIRRQRTVRYSPNTRGHQNPPSTSLPRRRTSIHGQQRQVDQRRSLLEDIRRRDGEAGQPFSASLRNEILEMRAAITRQQQTGPSAEALRAEASQRSRQESGRAHLRDALSYENPSHRMRITRDSTVPDAPEIRYRMPTDVGMDFEPYRAANATNDRPSTSPGHMPTPPYSSEDTSDSSPRIPEIGNATLTPGFAPAHQHHAQAESRTRASFEPSMAFGYQLPSLGDTVARDDDAPSVASHALDAETNRAVARNRRARRDLEAEMELLEGRRPRTEARTYDDYMDLAGLPRLRRMSRRDAGENANSNQFQPYSSHTNGLGDRQRSFSPEDDAWETMLTTIPPDERIPSATSSFTASATASASSLSSNSASSYGTLVTAPSTSADVEACPGDLSNSDSNSEVSDVEEIEVPVPRPMSGDLLQQSHAHLNRIDALSRRLVNQRSREGEVARQRRMEQRDRELSVLEENLDRLERQIDEERSAAASNWAAVRAGRERL